MKTLQSSLIRAIVAIIVGTLIIKYREETVRWLTIACGTLFFISGLISCAVYYSNRKSVKEQMNAEGKSITPATSAGLPLVGAGSIILGAILAFMPSTFVTGLMYTLAAILILGAVNQYINLGMASRWYHVGWFYWLLPTIILLIALFVSRGKHDCGGGNRKRVHVVFLGHKLDNIAESGIAEIGVQSGVSHKFYFPSGLMGFPSLDYVIIIL